MSNAQYILQSKVVYRQFRVTTCMQTAMWGRKAEEEKVNVRKYCV
jgi:hypothetical protein